VNWTLDPINCQRIADVAGAPFNADEITTQSKIRYCRTHKVWDNADNLRRGEPCVLLTSSSDSSVEHRHVRRLPLNVKRWFSNNVDVVHPRVEAIPIGFVFNTPRLEALQSQASLPRPTQENLLYLNFTRAAASLHGRRDGLYELFYHQSWATEKGGVSHDDVSAQDFYRDVASHAFVLSPPGAGPDCHRHWESMALGSIPVVLRSVATSIMDDMPCLQVDSWLDVTRDYLEGILPDLRQRFKAESMKKLTMTYWTERIQAWASK
jgi:hypothetical protein